MAAIVFCGEACILLISRIADGNADGLVAKMCFELKLVCWTLRTRKDVLILSVSWNMICNERTGIAVFIVIIRTCPYLAAFFISHRCQDHGDKHV